MEDFLENQKAIEELLMDMEIFEQIETKLSNFNAFETLGIVNTEIRHSNVLSWLLNPKENHGIGDVFIKKLIQTLFYLNRNTILKSNLTLFDISLMDYHDFNIRREWRNIDILAVSEENKLVLVIENKVWSKESNHQLKKYFDIVQKEFVGYNKVFVFLTLYGDSSSDEENWISFSYKNIFDILEKSVDLKKSLISQSVKLFIDQYLEVLRRYIVGDFELEKICKEIYYKHQKALDLIFEYKPDIYSEISYNIGEVLEQYPNIIKDTSNKTYTRFITEELDKIIEKKGSGWTSSNRILLYEVQNKNDKIVIKLIIGPGEDSIRSKIFNIAASNKTLFKGMIGTLTSAYTQIFAKELLPKNYINKFDNDIEAIHKRVKVELESVINGEMKKIDDYIIQNFV
ncbi:MAG: PD-(D/E)XK nuclease family protein [Clostridium sp.]|nr:PD-(D/E)XK nuclease family protein [Clostridium sp.]